MTVDKKLFAQIALLDEAVAELASGSYVIPASKDEPRYNLRALIKYADEKNIDTSELTDEELEMFRTDKRPAKA